MSAGGNSTKLILTTLHTDILMLERPKLLQ